MSQPIALGTVLGGRYKIVASLTSTPEGDHVLQGEDQILRRRVSILVPSAAHETLLVDNARALAGGAGHSGFQVLDMGQTEESTYLVTSYFAADDLLESLLNRDEDSDDESLSDDIFGGSRSAASASYIYEEPEPTQPQQVLDGEGPASAPEQAAVTRWSESDYDDYDDAPAAPSVRNRLGMRRKVRPGAVRSTMFDRAASQAGAAGASETVGEIDPTYDGDNRYESYARTEGKPGRLDERPAGSRAAGRDAAASASEGGLPDAEDAAAPAAGFAAGSGSRESDRADGAPLDRDRVAAQGSDEEPLEDNRAASEDVRPTSGATAVTDRRGGPVRWLLLVLLVLALVALIVLGFRSLGVLTSQFSQQGPEQQNAAPAAPGSAAPSSSEGPEPEIAAVTRVTSNPSFMSDTDATLNQATDGNPATYWLSYGFSNAQFGNLVQYVGLAAQLEQPARVQELTVQQANGTGGQFTVYVSDSPTVEGAEQVASGSFTGPEIRVPLSDAARTTPHRYVLIVWDQLPQLTSPIGGYQYGLRIGELSVR
ncbi:hypothetical protein [Kocuria varians]|uniref:hypothetical protein n=1 Tax=Kocuria varians TaxID=1272 RepID=UPI0008382CD9|nr:hypothetical protein [Kocuria varians]